MNCTDDDYDIILMRRPKEDKTDYSKVLKQETTIDRIKNSLDKTVLPYVKVRDLSNPFGNLETEINGKKGFEFGIKISF